MKHKKSIGPQIDVYKQEREFWALRLLARQEKIPTAIEDGNWTELTALRDFVSRGLRVGPGEPVLVQLKRLVKQTAQLVNSGLYARALEALADRNNDALAGALRRGLDAREQIIKAEGGASSLERAAKRLRISTGAVLRRAKLYQLVAWRDWREERLTYRFPVWQFEGNRLLPGIFEILQDFKIWHQWIGRRDDWDVMHFFLAPRRSLEGRRPLDLLRDGEVDRAFQLAHWADLEIPEILLRRAEDMRTGKVRGLTEAESQAQLDSGTINKQGRLTRGKRHRKRGGSGRSKATLTQEVLDWLNAPNPAFDGHSPRHLLEQGKTEPLLQMLDELEPGEPG